jgi:16S rRNA (guanine966-N2)-methyltransferase
MASPAATLSPKAVPNEVRIIGGRWKRCKLPVANRPGLRPTPDRVRETLFNWLGQSLSGWRCLDAFAGSGALGFEAASRDATEVTLLERDAVLARSLSDSKARLKVDVLKVVCADALTWMQRCAATSFELVFLDPPFDADLSLPALKAAARVVVADGFVYLESSRAFEEAELLPLGFKLHRHARAGAVHAHLLQRVMTL